MSSFKVMYFLRDCPVQWSLKLFQGLEILPVGELRRIHEADFIRTFCDKNNLPFNINPMVFSNDPMCKTPISILLMNDVQVNTIENIDAVVQERLKNVIATLSYYWKQEAVPFAVMALDKESGQSYWRLIENKLRRIIHLPLENPVIDFNTILKGMEESSILKHWFYMFLEGVRETNTDYKWFKYISLLEVIGEYLHERGRAPKDTKNSIRAIYSSVNLSLPKKRGAYDGIDVSYKHRHCTAHFGGCDPQHVSDCQLWCQDWHPDTEDLLESIESDLWFILRHAEEILK